jgi:hypothetical protein
MKGEATVLQGNSGEHTEKLKTLDENAIAEPTLVSSVEERLANLNTITKEPARREAVPEENIESTTPDNTDVDGNQADDDGSTDGTTPDDVDGNTDVVKDEVLPPAFLRAAIHRGWKEEDATEFFEANPEAAMKTFQNCYLDVNNATREWALLGKAKQQRDSVLNAPEAPVKIETVDIDRLKSEYDLDPGTIAVLEAQNRQIEALNAQSIQPSQSVQTVQTAQSTQPIGPDPNVELKIENFFNSANIADYSEFYGKIGLGQDWSDLSSGQRSNRWKVLEQANLIIMGSEAMGRSMDPLEALERSHMVVSEPVREQVIRSNLKKTATKRKNSMTIRPTSGTRSVAKVATDAGGKGKPRTRDELVTSVQENLDNVFNR